MEKQQSQAPSGMAGLVRYYESEKALIKLKPMHVVELAVAVIIIEFSLLMGGRFLLGI